jgi:hypothetical protein
MGSRSVVARRWVATAAAASVVVGATAAWSAPAPATRLYARDAGGACGDQFLHPAPGSGEGACFFVAQPVSDVSAAAGQPLHHEFAYDKRIKRFAPHGKVQVRVVVGHVQNTVGAGVSIVDVTLLDRAGSGEALGTASATGVVSPSGTDEFDLTVPVTAKGKPVERLVLRVEIRGSAAPHAYVRVNGRTWLDHAARR